MHFTILAHDATDDQAYERRLNARQAHMDFMADNIKRGSMLYGAALLDEHGKMKGSIIVTDFPSREAVDNWLAEEPYVKQKVWGDIQILPCQLGTAFEPLFKKSA